MANKSEQLGGCDSNEPLFIRALRDASAYPHTCGKITLAETHISWILLTGDYAYKIKKPVNFGFLDFSDLARRRYFCEQELSLNRKFAPGIYLNVVSITGDNPKNARIDGSGAIIDYAVKMRQFDELSQLDRQLDAGLLTNEDLESFAADLAEVHRTAPVAAEQSAFGSAETVSATVRENFDQMLKTRLGAEFADDIETLQDWSQAKFSELTPFLEQRKIDGFIRECHGDLHLSNIVRLDDAIHAFDCIEFNPAYRNIDVISDIAFLFMDCLVRQRSDLAYAFINRYLERSGDYQGGRLLAFYLVYRSLVRAKVAALQANLDDTRSNSNRRRFAQHIDLAKRRACAKPPGLMLMCGLSGSGKSFLAHQLTTRIPAIQLRSDVVRKRLAGLGPNEMSHSSLDAGLYKPQFTDEVYTHLSKLTADLIAGGETVIVDASFLELARREAFYRLARKINIRCVTVYCTAPETVLETRIQQRQSQGVDPSEAGLEVLRSQIARGQLPNENAENVVSVDTGQQVNIESVARLIGERMCIRSNS